jgi:hypothetical protein
MTKANLAMAKANLAMAKANLAMTKANLAMAKRNPDFAKRKCEKPQHFCENPHRFLVLSSRFPYFPFTLSALFFKIRPMSDRPGENLLSRLEQSLRQSRAARMHLAARLRELEVEADAVRAELAEMDTLATQSEAAIYRLLTSVLASGNLSGSNFSGGLPSDAELEAAMQPRPTQTRTPFTIDSRRQEIPTLRPNTEAMSDRFMDRTIPQAVTLLLREEGGALHVNEIYNRLLEGGFKFTGQNPTISIAVSLNRNTRFRKTAPGTFDLMIRDASRAS